MGMIKQQQQQQQQTTATTTKTKTNHHHHHHHHHHHRHHQQQQHQHKNNNKNNNSNIKQKIPLITTTTITTTKIIIKITKTMRTTQTFNSQGIQISLVRRSKSWTIFLRKENTIAAPLYSCETSILFLFAFFTLFRDMKGQLNSEEILKCQHYIDGTCTKLFRPLCQHLSADQEKFYIHFFKGIILGFL